MTQLASNMMVSLEWPVSAGASMLVTVTSLPTSGRVVSQASRAGRSDRGSNPELLGMSVLAPCAVRRRPNPTGRRTQPDARFAPGRDPPESTPSSIQSKVSSAMTGPRVTPRSPAPVTTSTPSSTVSRYQMRSSVHSG